MTLPIPLTEQELRDLLARISGKDTAGDQYC